VTRNQREENKEKLKVKQLHEDEYEDQDQCLKYYYSSKEEFENKNLECGNRQWKAPPNMTHLEAFNNIDEYSSTQHDTLRSV
jgi:hypothetical protein